MKNISIIIVSFSLFVSSLMAQDTEKILTDIAQNNSKLIALESAMEADKLNNKTGIFLSNPEFEFHYLWGKPQDMGQRTDISITQSFDFPSVYSHQNKIADLKNEQLEMALKKERLAILLQARQDLYQLTYLNAQNIQLEKRLAHAKSIANSYERKFKAGESNVLEFNKSQLNLLNLEKEMTQLAIIRLGVLNNLTILNGGKPITFTESNYQQTLLPQDFEEWYTSAEANNPMLNWLKQEMAVNQQEIKLSKALSMPKINAGYMSEKVGLEQFQGLIVGLSIPLWENKNTVKYAKAHVQAMEDYTADNKMEFYNYLKNLFEKAKSLEENTLDYRDKLSGFDHSTLLKKALDKGQITLIDYMLELSIYYESENRLLEMERDFYLTLAELYQFM